MAAARASVFLLVLAALSPSPVRADEPVVAGALRIDGLVAVVGALAPAPGSISILRTDVELRARVALSGAGAADAATASLPDSLLAATLEELLGEALIAHEAERLSLETPSATALRAERRRFEQKAGGAARLVELSRMLGVQERELETVVRRRALVNAFLEANLEGTLEVTDGELERAYTEGEHPFREQTLDEVREPLRRWLAQQRLERLVERWVKSLRDRTPHRVLVEF
jgi:hypothetical protein